MRVLLDTCVLSEIRNPKPDASVVDAVRSFSENDIFISVISLGEIEKGVSLLQESKRKRALSSWLDGLEKIFGERVIEINSDISRIWGSVSASAQKRGRIVHVADGLIAATAMHNGLHVMTRNVSDFEPTGALLINPWD